MRISPLSYAIHGVILTLSIGTAFADDTTSEEVADFGTLEVTVSANASRNGLMGAYAGGQVASGSRVGILGDTKNLETPFSTVSYTNDYIANQQTNSVGDVLKNDPSVRVARGFGNFQETYFIRGFLTNSDETMFNGLYGVLPRQYIASELFERVELQRGASSALNGASSGGGNIGGTIALLPKRAGNTPLRQVTVSTENGENIKVAADVGQRFGENNEFGVRTNVAYQTGGTVVDNEDKKLGLAAVGLDYRGDKLRVSSDIGYQNNELDKIRPSVFLNDFVVQNFKNDYNWSDDWNYSNEKDIFGTLRGEYDLTDTLTLYGAAGFLKGEEDNAVYSQYKVLNQAGNSNFYRFDNTRDNKIKTSEFGIKGNHHSSFLTDINHRWVASYTNFNSKETGNWRMTAFPGLNENIYDTSTHPDTSIMTSNGKTNITNKTSSVAFVDNMGFFDDRLNLMVAGRYQKLSSDTNGEKFSKSKFAPSVGLLYNINDGLSVYANYAENLNKGQYIVENHYGTPVTNGDTTSPAYVSKQTEIGIKYETGTMGATLAAFNTKKPTYIYIKNGNNTETFGYVGDEKHRGVELSFFGEPKDGLRLLGGVTYLDTKQGSNDIDIDGKRVIGVPKYMGNLGVEYDVAQVEGLTLTGDIIHTGNRYADEKNTLKVDGYTTLDVGVRYKTQLASTPVTIKGTISNVTNEKYWASVGGFAGYGYLVASDPTTLKLSATFDF